MRLLVLLAVVVLLTASPVHADPLKGFSVTWFDEKTALEDMLPLAEQGDRNALVTLRFMFLNGYGVPQDYIAAFMWADIAAQGGDEASLYARDIIGRKLNDAEVEEGKRLAREWLKHHPELAN
jgi:TPR repeat protein